MDRREPMHGAQIKFFEMEIIDCQKKKIKKIVKCRMLSKNTYGRKVGCPTSDSSHNEQKLVDKVRLLFG
jgi:hypothetical protein